MKFTIPILLALSLPLVILYNTKNSEPPLPFFIGPVDEHSIDLNVAGTCDSVMIFVQQLRTAPPSCCFQMLVDNKLRNAITQIKLDIKTATFTNIVVETNTGWIVSQTPQQDLLLTHNSGFIPLGGWSPLSFCLKGGNNPDSLKVTFNYNALGSSGACAINSLICSDPAPCDAAFTFQNITACGNVQFSNQSTGLAPITHVWNFGDPNSGSNNVSTAQNPSHQFSKCGNYLVCLKSTAIGCIDSVCKTVSYIDLIKPVIVCPPNAIVNMNQGDCFYTGTIPKPTATDNCDPMMDFTCSLITSSSSILITSQTQFPKGANTITCFAKDDCGNQSTNCNFILTVNDNQPPVIACPGSVTVMGTYNAQGQCKAIINNIAPLIVFENCPMSTVSYALSGSTTGQGLTNASGNNFMQGLTTVTYTVTQMGGTATGSCNFNVTVNCPPIKSKCDSVSAFILPFQAIPYACTYQFHIKNQATAISKIQIDLHSASFNSAGIVAQFSPVISPANRLTITHPSGIPIGNFHVTDLGINIGSNPDTAIVKFFYANGFSTCDTNIIFNCPVDSTCGYAPSCAVKSISLNTGLDNNGQILSPGSYDPNWTVTNSPYVGSSLPSPAEVIQKYSSWDFQPNSTAPCSQWISVFQGATQQNNVSFLHPYSYSRCFCVCKDRSTITIQLSALVDNNANFRLYDAAGVLVAPLLLISNPSNLPQVFQLPPDVSTTTLVLNKGTYCIRADVRNYANVTGINVCGSVSGEGLIRTDCCESNSNIVGHKYFDASCTGQPFSNQPTLPGWQIVLCNAAGLAIDTTLTDANGYYGFGPIAPGNYSVKEINQPGWTLANPLNNLVQVQLGINDVKEVNFGNCPPSSCDSISFWVESLKTIPPACCFRLHIDNKAKNKFLPLQVNLNTASFSNVVTDNVGGWISGQGNPGHLALTHNSNYIPVGSFTPISWCINAGSNPDTITIQAQFQQGQNTINCDTSFVFFCPPQPDTTCGIGCKADSISLNTGVDHSTGQFYAPGKPDAYWTVTQTPYPAYITPKPAYALATPSYWHDQPNAAMPCSRWINFSGGPYHYDDSIYDFTRCFCICKNNAAIQIHLSALADNRVEFTLCDSTGATIANLMAPKTTGAPFLNPAKDSTINLVLNKGRYCIKARVYNYGHTYTGFNVCGSIKGDGLVKEICCDPSTISGIKYLDTACVGAPYNGQQQGLQGWQIILCNNLGVAIDTMITDINGTYSFSPLLPGLYTIKELNPPGWIPSLPASGMSSIFLPANQVAQVNFANCPPEIDSCCKSKSLFAQHIANAVQLTVIDSMCKAKIILRLPACDSMKLIDWGDGQITPGSYSNGMWMHTYTQSGLYTIQIPITEYDIHGKPCFDTILKYTIEMYCTCECGNYQLSMIQDGIKTPAKCNDTIRFGCPAPQSIFLTGHFNCVGTDSCVAPNVQWTLTGPSINLSGNVYAGNILIPIPGALSPGYYTLNLQTTCGQKKCSCKITLYQRPCVMADSCTTYCTGTSWTQLNTSRIEDMVVYQGRLIVAGLFSTIGNPSVVANNIAAWNGTGWTALTGGGVNNVVFDLEVHNGLLYVGGQFTMAGNIPVNNIATWNGTTNTWANIPQGGVNGPNKNVYTMLSTSSGLFVGGLFNSAGTIPVAAMNIVLLHSSGWSMLASGLNGQVRALTINNSTNQVVAGGRFGIGTFNHVAIWNGSFWSKLGTGGAVQVTSTPPNSGDGVHDMISLGNDLIIGGQFLNAINNSGNPISNTRHIAKWNGASWGAMSTGVGTGFGIYDLHLANNELLAGGQINVIGNQSINLLAKWNGTTWSSLNHPAIGIVRSIALYSPNNNSLCNLYTGGEVLFNQLVCTSVATVDRPKTLDITVYPNPAHDRLFIQFNDVLQDEVSVKIYSLLGESIANYSFADRDQTKTIALKNLPNAGYVLKVSSRKGSIIKKILVMN